MWTGCHPLPLTGQCAGWLWPGCLLQPQWELWEYKWLWAGLVLIAGVSDGGGVRRGSRPVARSAAGQGHTCAVTWTWGAVMLIWASELGLGPWDGTLYQLMRLSRNFWSGPSRERPVRNCMQNSMTLKADKAFPRWASCVARSACTCVRRPQAASCRVHRSLHPPRSGGSCISSQ